jgi:hypothetical protein
MKKSVILTLIITFICALAANAQSADKVTEMIKTDKATWGQVCYFTSTYLGLVSENATADESIQALTKAGIIKSTPKADAPIPLNQIAYIYAKTWKIGGSLLLKLFPSPRYALKQLKADGLIPSSADPAKIYTGHQALDLFTSCMSKYGTEGAKK